SFALRSAPGDQRRRGLGDALVSILREHGEPMKRDALVAALRKKTSVNEITMTMYLSRPPFLWCESDLVGLLDRDLPGGAEARAQAVEHILTLLRRRRRGLAAAPLQATVALLSPEHARWSREMCLSMLGADARFRQNSLGAVGLATWADV